MYREIEISEEDKILIVAPHPDDETIGCGGILALYGKQCDVLLLTDGKKGVSNITERTEQEVKELRQREFYKVMKFFEVHKVDTLNIEDQAVYKNKKVILEYPIKQYSYIFVPNSYEHHIDHKVVYEIFKTMKFQQKSKGKIIEYEVWSPIANPNLFLDISAVIEKKIFAVSQYLSQLECFDYVNLCKGINKYRGATQQVGFCEAYYSKEEEKNIICKKNFYGFGENSQLM
jgi:LmbE family N-acetylglucosaminyl deacetylase